MGAEQLFSDHVYTLERNKYEKKFEIPASEGGWTVQFSSIPSGGTVQYDVQQIIEDSNSIPWKVTYMGDCHSTAKGGETKYHAL